MRGQLWYLAAEVRLARTRPFRMCARRRRAAIAVAARALLLLLPCAAAGHHVGRGTVWAQRAVEAPGVAGHECVVVDAC